MKQNIRENLIDNLEEPLNSVDIGKALLHKMLKR